LTPILMFFIDGLGLGPGDPMRNPLATFDPQALKCFEKGPLQVPLGGVCLATDATLDTEGLPQSATGQTTLFTGVNAARLVGRHLPGFPNTRLRQIIGTSSLFGRLTDAGLRVSFANTYTDTFFESPPRWKSVTTVMCESAGVRQWRVNDMQAQDSLFMDFTNRLLIERGVSVPLLSPDDAASRLTRHCRRFDFCLYEYFLTDMTAHRGSFEEAVAVVRDLDALVAGVLRRLDLSRHSVVLVSDHGNIEDLSTRAHTRGQVPTMLWGPIAKRQPPAARLSLQHITPWVVEIMVGRTKTEFRIPNSEGVPPPPTEPRQ